MVWSKSSVSRGSRGMGVMPLIITLVLFFIAAGFAYSYYTKLEVATAAKFEAESEERTQRSLADTERTVNAEVAKTIGYNTGDTSSPQVDTILARGTISRLASKYKPSEDTGGLPVVNVSEKMTTQQVIDQLDKAIDEHVTVIKNLQQSLRDKDAEVAAKVTAISDVTATGEKALENLRAELKVVEGERDEKGARADREARAGRDSLDEATNKNEEDRAEFARQTRAMKDELSFAKADVEKIKNKEKIVHERAKEMDGKIIAIDIPNNFALIDLGRRDGLRLGTRFDIIRVVHGTEEFLMGAIEVRGTQDRWAECNVVSVTDELNGIAPGDYIRNEVYDPLRTREFAFAGSVSNSRYSREEIGKLIENFGGTLVDAADVTTDVIILGAGYDSDDNYKRGEELNLETMTESELLRQLGR